jgi:hypothetical protein
MRVLTTHFSSSNSAAEEDCLNINNKTLEIKIIIWAFFVLVLSSRPQKIWGRDAAMLAENLAMCCIHMNRKSGVYTAPSMHCRSNTNYQVYAM